MFITKSDKEMFGTSPDRIDSFDDSSEMLILKDKIQKSNPNLIVVCHPYGKYSIDMVIRDKNNKDLFWIDLERSFGWKGNEYPYNHVSFLERKFHFVNEARENNARFIMVWFNKNLTRYVKATAESIENSIPFEKRLRNGKIDICRHLELSQVVFEDV